MLGAVWPYLAFGCGRLNYGSCISENYGYTRRTDSIRLCPVDFPVHASLCFFFPLGLPSVPMTQRNLPSSFWNLPSGDQTPQPPTSYPRHSNSLCLLQQNASEGTTYYSTGCHVTSNASHVSLGRTATNADDTYAFSVSCAQLAAEVVKSFPPGYLQQGPQPLPDNSGPLLTQETDVDCNGMQTSFRFNPSYNDLLIQPEVKPQLPLVPGEPAR